MKELQKTDQELLDRALDEWVVQSPLPPRFQENVWNRIAMSERKRPAAVWQKAWLVLIGSLNRPKVACSYAAVLVAFGIAAGSLAAQLKTSRLETELGQRYVLSIDPYTQTGQR